MERCRGCGDLYVNHRGDYDWGRACNLIRAAAAREGDDRGGFRSRGSVLWALRVLKAEDWMLSHFGCGFLIVNTEENPIFSLEWDDENPLF